MPLKVAVAKFLEFFLTPMKKMSVFRTRLSRANCLRANATPSNAICPDSRREHRAVEHSARVSRFAVLFVCANRYVHLVAHALCSRASRFSARDSRRASNHTVATRYCVTSRQLREGLATRDLAEPYIKDALNLTSATRR